METRVLTEKAHLLKERAGNVADRAREWQEKASDRAKQTGLAVHEYVHENAWLTVAIGTALGFAIGLLIMRRRD